MELKLSRIDISEVVNLRRIQVKAFEDIMEKYQDYDSTHPGCESIERIEEKLKQEQTYFYYLIVEDRIIGAIRVIDWKDERRKKVAPLFIMKEYRNQGYAQQAFRAVEKIHGKRNWELDTILQERANCYLYEKLGYKKTGKVEKISDLIDIVYYEKD